VADPLRPSGSLLPMVEPVDEVIAKVSAAVFLDDARC
jgi:hypothetical protein